MSSSAKLISPPPLLKTITTLLSLNFDFELNASVDTMPQAKNFQNGLRRHLRARFILETRGGHISSDVHDPYTQPTQHCSSLSDEASSLFSIIPRNWTSQVGLPIPCAPDSSASVILSSGKLSERSQALLRVSGAIDWPSDINNY